MAKNNTVEVTVEDLLKMLGRARRDIAKPHRQRIWVQLTVLGEREE